jgi:halogenation protein CepH
MRQINTDVVVVGGGPAGSTAATLLAQDGHAVTQLERGMHPRHQVGESLLPATIHGICRLLGVWDEVHEAGFMRKRGGTCRWGRDLEPWTFSFEMATLGGADYAFQVERARFDEILFRHAGREGVDTHERVDVIEPIIHDGVVRGVLARDSDDQPLRICADHVIDASGNGSRLSRHVGRRLYSEFFQNVAVYGYYRGASRLPEPNSGNIITAAFDHGWCWFIPLSDELTSVGAVVDRRHADGIRDGREQALERFVRNCPLVAEHLEGAERVQEGMYGEVRVRKDWSYAAERLHMPELYLVGDAACFIDPVFSSGVHLATYSGMLAARTINTIRADDAARPAAVAEYERRYRREFQLFYDFLLAFYDVEQEWDDYYWSARRMLHTQERGNEAFIRLVAGGATAPADFFRQREQVGASFREMIAVAADHDGQAGRLPERVGATDGDALDVATLNRDRALEARNLLAAGGEEQPLFEDGLVPTSDGLRWREP